MVKSFAFAAVLLLSSALSATAQSAREDIEATLTKFTDAFNSGNAAAVGQMYTEDAAVLPPDGSASMAARAWKNSSRARSMAG